MLARTSLSVLAMIAITQQSANADGFEIGATIGAHLFSSQSELGQADVALGAGPASSFVIGVRGGYSVSQRLALEAEVVVIPTHDTVKSQSAIAVGMRAHVRFDLLTGTWRPFVAAGYGAHALKSSSSELANDVDQSYHLGAGVRYAIRPMLDVRVDVRELLVPDRTRLGATLEHEITLCLGWHFGGHKAAAVAVRYDKPNDKPTPAIVNDNDSDHDGVENVDDKCPQQAETMNGYLDEDGCPDAVLTELTGINFEVNSATFDNNSTVLLDRAYLLLKENPSLRVEIGGHTSSEGDPVRNLQLSLLRAEAVKQYIVKRGISDERIRTVGYGSDQPIAGNSEESGRVKNRRIEFKILSADDL
jgi:outer membrane protein OmpA-like peptidoglycan-associated protein